jgi:hypothetical protein
MTSEAAMHSHDMAEAAFNHDAAIMTALAKAKADGEIDRRALPTIPTTTVSGLGMLGIVLKPAVTVMVPAQLQRKHRSSLVPAKKDGQTGVRGMASFLLPGKANPQTSVCKACHINRLREPKLS